MPKHIQPLTAKRLDAVHPRDGDVIELGDGFLPGLRVRISRGGRFWSLNIRNAKGERRRFDVGANLSLAEARRRAETLKQAIKQGGDPTGERREVRQRVKDAKAGIGTFSSVITAYFDRAIPANEERADCAYTTLFRQAPSSGGNRHYRATTAARCRRTPQCVFGKPCCYLLQTLGPLGRQARVDAKRVLRVGEAC
jgi:Arm DNA-binding domain